MVFLDPNNFLIESKPHNHAPNNVEGNIIYHLKRKATDQPTAYLSTQNVVSEFWGDEECFKRPQQKAPQHWLNVSGCAAEPC